MKNKMAKIRSIDYTKNKSFLELDWKIGEVMGLDNSDLDFPQPFILAIPERITRGFDRTGLRFVFQNSDLLKEELGKREEYTLHPRGYMLGLLDDGMRKDPKFDIIKRGLPNDGLYFVEKAYSGKETVKRALDRQVGFSYYALLMDKNKLVVERGPLGSLVEKLHLGLLLPNQLRIRGYSARDVVRGR